jgi:hypothetical protein
MGRRSLTAPSHQEVIDLVGREISPETIASCRSGDREAFRVLYDVYKDRVYAIALYFFHGEQAPLETSRSRYS